MKEYDYIAAADLYLDGELQGEELTMFENELKSNNALVEELKLHEEINKFIALYSFKQTLNEVAKEYFDEQKKYDKRIYLLLKNPYSIAAACIITLMISSILFWNFYNKKTPDLYSLYYTRIETPGITRGQVEDADLMMHHGIYSYEYYRYYSALQCFDNVLKLDSTRVDAIYYSAGAAMETKQYEKAEKFLLKIVPLNTIFKQDALWYLSLCYLKQGKRYKAKQILKDISSNKENYYYKKSIELQKEINQINSTAK